MAKLKRLERVREFFVGHKGRRLNAAGQEMPDAVPMAPPIGYRPAPSLSEQIREMVRGEHLRMAAEAAGYESFDEADDFDIPDDPLDPSTPYERVFEGMSSVELRRRADEAELREKAERETSASSSGEPVVAPAGKPAKGSQPAKPAVMSDASGDEPD